MRIIIAIVVAVVFGSSFIDQGVYYVSFLPPHPPPPPGMCTYRQT